MPPFGHAGCALWKWKKWPSLKLLARWKLSEGMVVKTQSPLAVEERKGIHGILLINHPSTAQSAIEAESAHCRTKPLMHGPGTSRFFEEKSIFLSRSHAGRF